MAAAAYVYVIHSDLRELSLPMCYQLSQCDRQRFSTKLRFKKNIALLHIFQVVA